jgi:glucose dehydrogenase
MSEMRILGRYCGKRGRSKQIPISLSRGLFVVGVLTTAGLLAHTQENANANWSSYGSDPAGTRYSPLRQITRENVSKLQVAWTHRTGALPHDPELDHKAAFEATPIFVDSKLF